MGDQDHRDKGGRFFLQPDNEAATWLPISCLIRPMAFQHFLVPDSFIMKDRKAHYPVRKSGLHGFVAPNTVLPDGKNGIFAIITSAHKEVPDSTDFRNIPM